MNIRKSLATLGIVTLLGAGMVACDTQEGPFERGGEEVDRAVDDTGDAMQDAGESVRDSMEDAGDRMEDATD